MFVDQDKPFRPFLMVHGGAQMKLKLKTVLVRAVPHTSVFSCERVGIWESKYCLNLLIGQLS